MRPLKTRLCSMKPVSQVNVDTSRSCQVLVTIMQCLLHLIILTPFKFKAEKCNFQLQHFKTRYSISVWSMRSPQLWHCWTSATSTKSMPVAEAGELLVSDTRVVNYHTQEVAIVAHHVSNSHSKRICTAPQQGPFFQALRFVCQPCSVLSAELHHVGRYTFHTSLHPDSCQMPHWERQTELFPPEVLLWWCITILNMGLSGGYHPDKHERLAPRREREELKLPLVMIILCTNPPVQDFPLLDHICPLCTVMYWLQFPPIHMLPPFPCDASARSWIPVHPEQDMSRRVNGNMKPVAKISHAWRMQWCVSVKQPCKITQLACLLCCTI